MAGAIARAVRIAWISGADARSRPLRCAQTSSPTATRWHRGPGTAAPREGGDDDEPHIDAFLAPFKNYEKTVLPDFRRLGTLSRTNEQYEDAGTTFGASTTLLRALGKPHLWEKTEHTGARWGPGFQTRTPAPRAGSTVGSPPASFASGYNTATYKSPHVHARRAPAPRGPIPPRRAGGGRTRPPYLARQPPRGDGRRRKIARAAARIPRRAGPLTRRSPRRPSPLAMVLFLMLAGWLGGVGPSTC